VKETREINQDLFEKVIAYNILTNEYYTSIVIDALKNDHLKHPGVKLIARLVFDFYKKRGSLPNTTEIKLYLKDDAEKELVKELVRDFKTLDLKYNIDELVSNTERFIKERAIYNAVLETVDKYSKNDINTTETYQLFEKACSLSLVDNLGLDFFEQIDKFAEDIKRTDTFLSSGWKWLDEKLGGGFISTGRALYVFSGQTNVGKSIFLGNIASNIAAQGKTVLVITLEMSETVYGKRIGSKISKIPFRELQERTNELKDTLQAYKEQNPNAKIIFKEFPPKAITVNHLKAFIKKLVSKGIKPDAIVCDYLNLIAATDGDNSYEKIKEVAEQLRAISYIFECPVITATQLNRSGYNTQPELDQISESMGLGHTADVMIGIFQDDGDDTLGNLRLSIMKNRFGDKAGVCIMKIDYSTLTLSETTSYFGNDNEVVKSENILDQLSDKTGG
jgi:replicative DNA helicase